MKYLDKWFVCVRCREGLCVCAWGLSQRRVYMFLSCECVSYIVHSPWENCHMVNKVTSIYDEQSGIFKIAMNKSYNYVLTVNNYPNVYAEKYFIVKYAAFLCKVNFLIISNIFNNRLDYATILSKRLKYRQLFLILFKPDIILVAICFRWVGY